MASAGYCDFLSFWMLIDQMKVRWKGFNVGKRPTNILNVNSSWFGRCGSWLWLEPLQLYHVQTAGQLVFLHRTRAILQIDVVIRSRLGISNRSRSAMWDRAKTLEAQR